MLLLLMVHLTFLAWENCRHTVFKSSRLRINHNITHPFHHFRFEKYMYICVEYYSLMAMKFSWEYAWMNSNRPKTKYKIHIHSVDWKSQYQYHLLNFYAIYTVLGIVMAAVARIIDKYTLHLNCKLCMKKKYLLTSDFNEISKVYITWYFERKNIHLTCYLTQSCFTWLENRLIEICLLMQKICMSSIVCYAMYLSYIKFNARKMNENAY